MKPLIVILCFLAGGVAVAQTWNNTIDGFFEANFGIGIGGHNRLINLDSQVSNVLNCGSGAPGNRGCIILAGYLDLTGALTMNGQIALKPSGTGILNCGATTGARDCTFLAGYADLQHALTINGTANIDSNSPNVINLGNGTVGNRGAVVLGGFFDASGLFSSGGHNGETAVYPYVPACTSTVVSVRNGANTAAVNIHDTTCTTSNVSVTGGIGWAH
jgi:hypothetical protein